MSHPVLRSLPILLVALVIGLVGAVWLFGSRNPVTPAGYVGYLTQGAIMGKEKYVGLQSGPTSPGRRWLLKVLNVSITPYTYNEEFIGPDSVLSKDNLKISFRVHIVWKIKPEMVKDFVEKFSTIDDDSNADSVVRVAYNNFLREPLRTFARDEVQQLDGMKIKDEISPIGRRIQERVLELAKGTPFEITSVVVGNIQYPEQVAEAVSRKLAATQEFEQKQIEIEIARRSKEIRVIEAEGIAQSMEIINTKLTSAYLQHEAIEAQKAMVGSPNHTTVYIPVGPMGVPVVGTFDAADPRPSATPGR